MGEMKGITPIIAIIVLLLITLALAGAAWTYLSTFWTGLTGKTVGITDSQCIRSDTAVVFVRNTGSQELDPATDIFITDSNGDAVTPSGGWKNMTGQLLSENIKPGEIVKFEDSCGSGNLCAYRIVVGGRSLPASVQC